MTIKRPAARARRDSRATCAGAVCSDAPTFVLPAGATHRNPDEDVLFCVPCLDSFLLLLEEREGDYPRLKAERQVIALRKAFTPTAKLRAVERSLGRAIVDVERLECAS